MPDPSDQLVHKAAWLYHSKGLRQDEIAKILGLSRASVVNYLKRAKESGVVTVSISTASFEQSIVARKLEEQFVLEMAWVVEDTDGTADFSSVAAMVLSQITNDGDRMALAWGQTVYEMVKNILHSDFKEVSIYQMCGNLGSPYGYRPEQCTVELAKTLNAEANNIYAPLVVSSEKLAESLNNEPLISDQLQALSKCNIAVFSVGSCTPNSHIVTCGATTVEQISAYKQAGATGVVAGRLLDENGNELTCEYNRRLIAISLSTLAGIETKLVLVDDAEKSEALLSAIKGNLVTHLVVTQKVAEQLLSMS